MKVIEILKLNKGMLKTCRKVGIRMEDVQYIELYNDYNRLLDEGEKVSSILELCEWIGKNKNIGNPFEGCTRMEFNAHINYSSSYTDMMLFKKEAV